MKYTGIQTALMNEIISLHKSEVYGYSKNNWLVAMYFCGQFSQLPVDKLLVYINGYVIYIQELDV